MIQKILNIRDLSTSTILRQKVITAMETACGHELDEDNMQVRAVANGIERSLLNWLCYVANDKLEELAERNARLLRKR